MKFSTGNVVKDTDGRHYVVGYSRNNLIPMSYCNSTVHPPDEDYYEDVDMYDEYLDQEVPVRTLMMDGIDKYIFVSRTVEDFILSGFKKMMFGST